MWKLKARGERGSPFVELGDHASLADAARIILKTEDEPHCAVFFRVYVDPTQETTDADAPCRLAIPDAETFLPSDPERSLMAGTLSVLTDRRELAPLDQLAAIPEEEIGLAKQKSARTRRAYRLDVRHFMKSLCIETQEQLRHVDHRAVIAWERMQREQEGAAASTIRRRLAALSSLFKHLVKHGGRVAILWWTWTDR